MEAVTKAVLKDGILYVKIPTEFEKELGYSNDWIAIEGIPPELKAYSSTHLEEAPHRIADTLDKLKKSKINEVLQK